MAKKTTKSSFMERITQAHEEHKGDETRVGSGGDLPAGIEQGIAKLVDAKIGIYKKGDNEGEPFFMAAGTVLDPDSVTVVDPKTKKSRVIPIRGLRTQIGPEPICDTTNAAGKETSMADHWDRVLNHLRLLGIDTKTIDPDDIVAEPKEGEFTSGPVLEALVEAAPTFRFRTWQGKPTQEFPNPRVNHEWRGVCEYEAESPDSGVRDEEAEEAPQWESDATKEEPAEDTETTELEDAQESGPSEDPDFLAIAEVADAGKPKKEAAEAQKVLTGHAKILGIEGYESMGTWREVAEAILAHEEPSGDEPQEDEAEEYEGEWTPEDGGACLFNDPKAKKPVECEIIKVYTKLQKADLKRMDNKKVIKRVPLDKLSESVPFTG